MNTTRKTLLCILVATIWAVFMWSQIGDEVLTKLVGQQVGGSLLLGVVVIIPIGIAFGLGHLMGIRAMKIAGQIALWILVGLILLAQMPDFIDSFFMTCDPQTGECQPIDS